MTKHSGNINSLPLWAQRHIRHLEARIKEADRRYNEAVDKLAQKKKVRLVTENVDITVSI